MKTLAARPRTLHLIVILLYTLLAVLTTAPLTFRLGDHLLGTDSNALNDTFFSIWIFGWQAHQLIADPLNLFQGNIFYPFQNSLAFSEIILPGALLYLPLASATQNPVLAYNLVVLLTFPLNAFAMYLFTLDVLKRREDGRRTTEDERRTTKDDGGWGTTNDERRTTNDDGGRKSTNNGRRTMKDERPANGEQRVDALRATFPAAFVAGLIFGFCTYKMGEIRHVQLLLALFMPLTLMYVARFLRVPNLHNGFFTALFFGLNALCSLYYAVFLAFAVALFLAVEFLTRQFRITRFHFIYGVVAAVITAVIVLPFLLPFLRLESQYNFSEGRDPRLFSARPASYLASPASQILYGELTRSFYVASKGQPLFPGLVSLALGIVGIVALVRGGSRLWLLPLLLALMGFILSFGPELILGRATVSALPFPLPYHYLARIVSPLASLNAPARFAVLVMLALALLAAHGISWLIQKNRRMGYAITAAAVILITLEYAPAPLRLVQVAAGANISPVYPYLADQPKGQPVVELPMGMPTFADQDKYVEYTYHSIYHLQPLINGYSTFLPPDYYALVKAVQTFPSQRSAERLKTYGAHFLVIHSDRYEKPDAIRKRLDRIPTLQHVRDFGEIWLYRIAP